MLSWITGPRSNDATHVDTHAFEPSMLEPPETPAPMFAVNAFKHALFGTPAPDEPVRKASAPGQTFSTTKPRALDGRRQRQRMRDHSSPTKPLSILLTPGTVNGRRKNVTFGSGVVDNEAKRPAQSNASEAPSDCPGKFPSPYTPKEKQSLDSKARTDLITLRQEARGNGEAGSGPQPMHRAKDDTDVTLDVLEPRSQSGRYWKETHEAYATKSEKETRKLIAKHKLAKDFAKKKDAEAAEARLKLESERKKHRTREKSWETSMKDIQERLRQAVADNAKYAAELALMRQQVEATVARDGRAVSGMAQLSEASVHDASPQLPKCKTDDSRLRMSSSPQLSAGLSTSGAAQASSAATVTTEASGCQYSGSDHVDHVLAPGSSDPIPTPTPVAASRTAEQGSRAYRVTKKPVMVTTAQVKGMQSISMTSQNETRSTVRPAKVAPQQVAVAEDSDLDLWAISNFELSNNDSESRPKTSADHHPARGALMSRTANNAGGTLTAVQSGKSIKGGVEVKTTKTSRQASQPLEQVTQVTSDEQENLGHSQGTLVFKRSIDPSLANVRTTLPLSREEQARQRVLARRAKRRTRDGLQEEEKTGAVLARSLGS